MTNWKEEYPLNTFNGETKQELIKFISNIRKKDEEELIKMLPIKDEIAENETIDGHAFKIGRNSVIWEVKQLIKDFYNK